MPLDYWVKNPHEADRDPVRGDLATLCTDGCGALCSADAIHGIRPVFEVMPKNGKENEI